jgi:hypothetical protein
MVTVLRADDLRVVINVNVNQPVHVFGEAKINLIGPELVWADGMTRGEVRRAMRLVSNQSALLRRKWEEIHG